MSPTSGPKINDTGCFSINPLICFSPMESRLITSSQSHFDKTFPFTDSNTSTLRKQHLKSRIIQRYHHFGNISKPKVSYNVPINLDMSQNCKTPELPPHQTKKESVSQKYAHEASKGPSIKKKNGRTVDGNQKFRCSPVEVGSLSHYLPRVFYIQPVVNALGFLNHQPYVIFPPPLMALEVREEDHKQSKVTWVSSGQGFVTVLDWEEMLGI